MPEWFVIGGIILIALLILGIVATLQGAYDEYMESRNW